MRTSTQAKIISSAFVLLLSADALTHGLIESPKSRNQICGVEIKPDQSAGTACEAAFVNDFTGGYQFMSVLTHDVGRAGVTPLPNNVCGFDAEPWQGGATPWDTAIDWPTQAMSPGNQAFIWNISWGPHFEDTEEFRYWITKPDFEFVVGQPLTWDDFETEAFCYLPYDHSKPNANPNVVPELNSTKFVTYCNVPQRTGRHVIYAEWGRNYFTYERFHSCIDTQFSGGGPVNTPPQADNQTLAVQNDDTVAITLSGSDGDGSIMTYTLASEPTNGNLVGSPPNLTYLPNANFVGEDQFTFTVIDNEGAESEPAEITITVSSSGSENQAPTASFTSEVNGLSINLDATSSSDPDNDALSFSWNFGDGASASGSVVSHTYASDGTYAVSLTASDAEFSDTDTQMINISGGPGGSGALLCDYVVSNSWGSGFVASIRLTNTGNETINGWSVNWAYATNSQITSSWNTNLGGSNPYSASNLSWNASIAPGETVEFGVQGNQNGASTEVPQITGDNCQ